MGLLGFKNIEEEDKDNCPLGDDLCERMNTFHHRLMNHVSLQALLAPEEEDNTEVVKLGPFKKLYNLINAVKELEEEKKEEPEPEKKTPEETFRKVLIATIVRWAEETQIETSNLVQEMFRYVMNHTTCFNFTVLIYDLIAVCW